MESARYWWFVPLAVPALVGGDGVVHRGSRRGDALRLRRGGGGWRCWRGVGSCWTWCGSIWGPDFRGIRGGAFGRFPGGLGDVMIQPAAWVGTPGLTLATVLIAGLPTLGPAGLGWRVRRCWRVGLARGRGGCGSRMGRDRGLWRCWFRGTWRKGRSGTGRRLMEVFRRHLALSAEGVAAAGGRPSVVIWPETSSVFLLQSDPAAREADCRQAIRPARGCDRGEPDVHGGGAFELIRGMSR